MVLCDGKGPKAKLPNCGPIGEDGAEEHSDYSFAFSGRPRVDMYFPEVK